jgi:hypothetical protein
MRLRAGGWTSTPEFISFIKDIADGVRYAEEQGKA